MTRLRRGWSETRAEARNYWQSFLRDSDSAMSGLPYDLHSERRMPPKRSLRVTKWIGQTPAEAACSLCSRTFTVPINALSRVALAQESLQQQFIRHKCETQEAG